MDQTDGESEETMGLRENLHTETVGSLPLREAIAVKPDTIVRDAVAIMREKALGCAVMVDADGKPVGIFTERSLLDALMRDGSFDSDPVSDFADPKFLRLKSSEPIARVWKAIQRDQFRFICVTDDADKLMGLTGQRGLAEYVSEYFPRRVMVQRLGGKPWMQQREGA